MLARYGDAQYEHVSLWKPEADNVRKIKSLIRRLSALEKIVWEKVIGSKQVRLVALMTE